MDHRSSLPNISFMAHKLKMGFAFLNGLKKSKYYFVACEKYTKFKFQCRNSCTESELPPTV